jgi:hypothetical protein
VNGREGLPLFLHVLRGAHPPIVIDMCVDAGDLELVGTLFFRDNGYRRSRVSGGNSGPTPRNGCLYRCG